MAYIPPSIPPEADNTDAIAQNGGMSDTFLNFLGRFRRVPSNTEQSSLPSTSLGISQPVHESGLEAPADTDISIRHVDLCKDGASMQRDNPNIA